MATQHLEVSMSVPTQSVTLSMFWPLLLHAAMNADLASPAVCEAAEALTLRAMRDGLNRDAVEVYAEDVAEEVARRHFPTGAVGNVGWDGSDPSAAWWADDEVCDDFLEVITGLEEVTGGKLSPTDPAHVALVARVLAISVGLQLYVEPPIVRIRLDEVYEETGEPTERGYVVRLERSRPMKPREGSPLSAGRFIPYAPGQTAETVDYGEALFAWFLAQHADVVAYLERQEEAGANDCADAATRS